MGLCNQVPTVQRRAFASVGPDLNAKRRRNRGQLNGFLNGFGCRLRLRGRGFHLSRRFRRQSEYWFRGRGGGGDIRTGNDDRTLLLVRCQRRQGHHFFGKRRRRRKDRRVGDPVGLDDNDARPIRFGHAGSALASRRRALWAAAGIEPGGGWYLESGQGMGASLTVADQREAYILTDRGTFLALRGTLELVAISEGDPALLNFYSVALVNPAKGRINAPAAAAWAVFLLRADVQNAIGAFRREEFGRSLFIPAAGQSEDAIATVIAAEAGNSATSGSTANDEE